MSAIRKILVPTDFSHASRVALRYACTLADDLQASLHILHATDYPYFIRGYGDFYPLPQEMFDQIEQDVTRNLNGLLSAEEQQKYHVTLVHRTGEAAQEILAYVAEQGDINAIVMATHGRGGVARLMMGSVADKIVRAAPCPVVTIRAPEESARSGRAA
jgi:nucleotide-binding universal stress UspA family protein